VILKNNFEKYIYLNFPVCLFVLLPLFLITGPFLSDLAVSLISILFLIYCIKINDFSFFKNKYFYIFIFFWLYLFLNSLFNNVNLDSLKISFFYFRYGVFVVAIITLMNFDYKFINYFFYCIFFCFSCLILDGFYQYLMGENILGWKKTYRTSSFFGDEKILGSYLSRLWPIFFGIYILIFKQKNQFFIIFMIMFILSEVLIFLSGDRTAFFYINFSAIIVMIFSQSLLKLRLFTLVSSILLILTISYFNPTAKERVFDQTINQMNLFNNDSQKEIYLFSKQHTHHYVTAYKIFLDNKVFGVGVKNFRNFCSDEKYEVSSLSCSTHPHNIYIQILSETGVFGFLFIISIFLTFVFYLIKHLILKINSKVLFTDFEICILSGIAIYLWPIIPTGSVFNNWLNIIMILNLPFLIWSRKLTNLNNR
jgi:O-antigen ligase